MQSNAYFNHPLQSQVFIGSGDGRIIALNQTDGFLIWSPATHDYVTASVAVSRDNEVFAASSDKFVYAMNGVDGSIIWKFQTGAAVVATPALFPEDNMPVGWTIAVENVTLRSQPYYSFNFQI